MRPKELIPTLADALRHREQLLVIGPPGYGKTGIIQSAVAAIGYDLIVSHPAIDDPTDYKGLPARSPDGISATFLPFGQLHRAITATRPTAFFIDDVGQGSEAVQKALMQVLHGRRLNGHVIPDHVTFVGASNDVRQMAGVQGMIEPIKSRWTSIVHLEGHRDDWCEWAIDNDMPSILIAFMRSPESVLPDGTHLLYAFKPTRDFTNSPCPRTWEAVGRMFQRGVRNHELFAGAVGQAAAAQFMAFVSIAEKCPGLEEILLDPEGTPIPDGASLQALVAVAIGRALNASNAGQFFRYLWRMNQPFRILTLQDTLRKWAPDPLASAEKNAERAKAKTALRESSAFTQWAIKEGSLLAT